MDIVEMLRLTTQTDTQEEAPAHLESTIVAPNEMATA
jgi:hypothetical protein